MVTRVDDALRSEVRQTVQSKLALMGFTVPEPATPLDEPLDEVRQAICNYCNIDFVPLELKYVWANMVVDLWRWMQSLAVDNSSSGQPNVSGMSVMVSSLKEGDTTVNFSAATSAHSVQAGSAHSIAGALDQVVTNYQDQLNRFRRVVW